MSLNVHLRVVLMLTFVALSNQECADGFYEKNSNCYNCLEICTKCTSRDVCSECLVGSWGSFCDKKCPNECLNDTCHVTSGDCKYGCKLGYPFGTETCPCPRGCVNDVCDQDTGHCTEGCEGLWYGTGSCPCPAGCQNNTCDKTGFCTEGCKPGYTRGTLNCPDCPPHCKEDVCDEETGFCYAGCKDGFYGDDCSRSCPSNCIRCLFYFRCSECKPGRYGYYCQDSCSYCENSTCSQHTGSCTNGCKSGFHGTRDECPCDEKCQDNECDKDSGECTFVCNGSDYGTISCPCPEECGNYKCDAITGNCTEECKEGYQYVDSTCILKCSANCESCDLEADNCIKCDDGFHGRSCILTCPSNCLTDTCEKVSGQCSAGCNPGYYNTHCEDQCPGCINGSCDQDSGQCKNGCKEGYHGTAKCPCPDNCRNEQCDTDTGHCANGCKDGYYGDVCSLKCLEKCTSCTNAADKCTECFDGHHGSSCSLSCPANCKNSICTKETGRCKEGCRDSYFGDNCDQSCPNGCDKCVKYDDCVTCKQRFYLSDRRCLECPPQCKACDGPLSCSLCDGGYHGPSCQSVCPTNCLGRLCHQSNGVCLETCDEGQPCCPGHCNDGQCSLDGVCSAGCLTGYYGNKCEEKCDEHCASCTNHSNECNVCDEGFYGTDGCKLRCPDICSLAEGKLLCGISDGSCINGCRVKTKYGPHCTEDCSHNCVDRECDQVTWRCSKGCESGYFGDTCKDVCSNFCLHATCYRETGTCLDGCISGFSGAKCRTANLGKEEKEEEEVLGILSVWLFAIGGVTILLLVGFIVMAAVMCLGRRRRKSNRKDVQYGFELPVALRNDGQTDVVGSGEGTDQSHDYEQLGSATGTFGTSLSSTGRPRPES